MKAMPVEWHRISRRTALAGAAIAAVASSLAPRHASRAQIIRTGGGVAGGGLVRSATQQAEFSLFASRFEREGEPVVFLGGLQWVDEEAGIHLVSTEITSYGRIPGGIDSDRELRGRATNNGQGDFPFVARITDAAGPGEGKDTLSIEVGKDGAANVTDPIYTLSGDIATGDLQILEFSLPF